MPWLLIAIIAALGIPLGGCKKKLADPAAASLADAEDAPFGRGFLYIAAGICGAGPNTTFTTTTSSNSVYRVDLETGEKDLTLADYFAAPANTGDSPVGIAAGLDGELKVLVENATTALRRIERIPKADRGERTIFSANVTALNQNLRSILTLANGDFLIAKRTGIEYLTATGIRIGTPFANPSLNPCVASNTGITRAIPLAEGNVAFLHAATGQNRIGILGPAGGTTCASVQAAPQLTAFPTAGFYDAATGSLVVAYAGASSAVDLNSIYAYDVNSASGALSNARKLYDANGFPGTYPYLLFSISEMIFDPETRQVYVATAVNTATTVVNYQIERFTLDATKLVAAPTEALVKDATTFYPHGSDTKCISQMLVAE